MIHAFNYASNTFLSNLLVNCLCIRWDLILDGDKKYKDMDRLVAYEKGLKTWVRWVDLNLKSTKTKVFFQGVSPDHMK